MRKRAPKVGGSISLPPGKRVRERRDGVDERPRLRRGEPRDVLERADDGQRPRGDRPRDQGPRPVAQERRSLPPGRFEERSQRGEKRAQRRGEGMSESILTPTASMPTTDGKAS